MATSSAFFSGILMAVIGREKTGEGTFVSTSLMASGIWCNAIGVVSHQKQFAGDRVNDPLRPSDPFSHFYKCGDGRYIGIFDNEYCRDLPKFARLLGIEDILDDPRCATLEAIASTDAVVEVVTRLNEIFLTKPSAEWIKLLEENNISCELMRRLSDVGSDEQAIANGFVEEVEFKDGLKVMMPCPPVKFSNYATRPYTPAGVLGADTDSVFAELGYSAEDIARMRENKAII